jgi:hypothetical protein
VHTVTASSEAAAAAGGPGTAGPVDAQKVAETKKVGAKASCCSSRMKIKRTEHDIKRGLNRARSSHSITQMPGASSQCPRPPGAVKRP